MGSTLCGIQVHNNLFGLAPSHLSLGALSSLTLPTSTLCPHRAYGPHACVWRQGSKDVETGGCSASCGQAAAAGAQVPVDVFSSVKSGD